MHRIYSSADGMSIYPLVFNLEWLLNKHKSESDPMCNQENTLRFVKFWLNSIAQNSGGAPVLLIATHKDKVINNADRSKSNADLARTNDDIKRAHKIIGDCITSMRVYSHKKLRLHMPPQPGPLHTVL